MSTSRPTRRSTRTTDGCTPSTELSNPKSKKRPYSSKVMERSKVRITVNKAAGRSTITQVIPDARDSGDDSTDRDLAT
ncbi:hypothetical protein BDZ91DRAFT_793605 [Kalaharituber pfeilii]|nr:hypothetical protein BDZ91DRAFT_793605 [Kalaharituber pfeilii]